MKTDERRTGGKRQIWQVEGGLRIKQYQSITAAGRDLQLCPKAIGAVLEGRVKKCGGYFFEYVDVSIAGEVWKEHPAGYLVSNLGRVKRHNGYITVGWAQRDGYLQIRISGKTFYVHRLVLETFVGECPEGMECDHIDRNRSNNRIENLRWITVNENRTRNKNEKYVPSKAKRYSV